MADRIAIARLWTEGLSAPDVAHVAAVADVLAEDVSTLTPLGTTSGKVAVLTAFGKTTLAADFAAGTWSKPDTEGATVAATCTFPAGASFKGATVKVTVGDDGYITRVETTLLAAPAATSTPPTPEQLTAHLQQRYGIAVQQLTLPEGHNPFVLRVHRADGPHWIARMFGPNRPQRRVEEEAEILRFLERHNYPAERCAHDEPVSSLNGWTVLVTGYAGENGQEDPSVRQQLGSLESLERLGDMLGQLNTLPAEAGAVARDGGAWHGDARFEGLPSQDIEAAKAMLDEFDHRVPADAREKYDWLRAQVDALDDCGDLPRALVHPDFMWKNVVIAPGGALIAVDWTGAGRGPRIAAFANLILAGASARGVDRERVQAVVTGYRRHVQLEPAELDRLSLAIRIRELYFACYYYRMSANTGYYAKGNEGWWPGALPEEDGLVKEVAAAFNR